MVTCCVFRRDRKGPEPEEMDKDMILQEKEAEVGHRSWQPWWYKWLLCVYECWVCHTWGILPFHSWDECKRWSPRCRPKCRSRETERVKAPMCETFMVSLQIIDLSNHTISLLVVECHEMWSLLFFISFYGKVKHRKKKLWIVSMNLLISCREKTSARIRCSLLHSRANGRPSPAFCSLADAADLKDGRELKRREGHLVFVLLPLLLTLIPQWVWNCAFFYTYSKVYSNSVISTHSSIPSNSAMLLQWSQVNHPLKQWRTVCLSCTIVGMFFSFFLFFLPSSRLFPCCSCSCGKPKCRCCQTPFSARANLCSVKELYRERRLSSQLVAEIHFHAFLQTHNAPMKRASSFGFMWPPSPACKLGPMQNFVLCSHAGMAFSRNPPLHTQCQHQCLSTMAREGQVLLSVT